MLVETRIWFSLMSYVDRGIDHLIDADTVIVNQRLRRSFPYRNNGCQILCGVNCLRTARGVGS